MWDHTVRSGESLWLIATRYKKNFNDILQLNPQIKDKNKILPGMSVHMPDPPPQGEVTLGPITVISKPAAAPVQVPEQTSHAADTIDDDKVQKILDYAADIAFKKNPQSDAVDEARDSWQILYVLRRWNGSPQTIPNYQGWQSLLELPQTPLDRNLELMAAEHYGFARYVAAGCGDPHTESVLKTYFAAKSVVSFFPGGEKLLRTDPNHPVLPESPASLKWKSKGVQDGLLDYKKEHGGHLGENFSSRSVVTNNIGPQYQKAKSTVYGP
jgi:LysM repeat protein